MSAIKRIVLDVLKPHQPNALDFASAIADQQPGCRVKVTVTEMEEKTEITVVELESDHNTVPDDYRNHHWPGCFSAQIMEWPAYAAHWFTDCRHCSYNWRLALDGRIVTRIRH